jgi:hypothetical protein
MSAITWQTPAGSLGVIAEQTFFTLPLLATTPFTDVPANCVETLATSNIIVCDSTAGVSVGQSVLFFGETFGNVQENTVYYVRSVISSTQFTITDNLLTNPLFVLQSDTGIMTARFFDTVRYSLQAGTLPQGIQLGTLGIITGVPQAGVSFQGVPLSVAGDTTSKFTVRAYTTQTVNNRTVIDTIAERTFTLTITGNDTPEFITPAGSLGNFYDGDGVDIQIQFQESDSEDDTVVRLLSGELPPGLTLSPTGRLFGFIRPMIDVAGVPGYDITASGTEPYDFISNSFNRNYEFTLEVTDGKANDLRTFTVFVYDRSDLTADDTTITSDNTFVTADQTTVRMPFLINAEPSDLGIVRGDNYFAYRFIGQDYDTEQLEYTITVNQGFGLPPGLELDPYTGWYYGFVPDIEPTRLTYSFNVQVRARSLVCSATDSSNDIITCDQTTRGDFYVGSPVTFEGTGFGGISAGVTYYVAEIVSDTEFKISDDISGIPVKALTTDTGRLLCVPQDIPASQLYPFTLTVTSAEFEPITWITPQDLGVIENGSVSTLAVEAQSAEGFELEYQLPQGSDSSLPQGLELLPNGLIAGRVSFNTFSIDLGSTTFDASQSTITRIETTTFDSEFDFDVEAYLDEPNQALFKVSTVRVINGGSGYVSAPALEFSAPIGATGVRATATAVVQGGTITAINVTNSGAGYLSVPTLTVTGGDGVGQILEVVMQQTGNRYLVSDIRRFSVRVLRVNNKPYQNLAVMAMPPDDDRMLLDQLLTDHEIFVPEYIYRAQDPNFGVARNVLYQHAFGLDPDTLDTYVQSLEFNHYWKNLVLGSISTAQARDAAGNVIYEVVYSNVIDDLVNAQGDSVSKIVTLPYAAERPDSSMINSVYPNSLINMRDQVIDVVGQISNRLPLWMISKQQDGTVLGFRPAWVICYTLPGRSRQIAYYLREYFGERLNLIDFKVDRYVLDDELSRNWDAETQRWRPPVNQTTFDRINTTGYNDLGMVNACTTLAFADVNARSTDYINALGGLDGLTWAFDGSRTPPVGTRVIVRNGSLIAFVKQERFFDYTTSADAFTNNIDLFDDAPFDSGNTVAEPGSFDYGKVIPGGYVAICSATLGSGSNSVVANTTLGMSPNDRVWFTGATFGGIETNNSAGGIQDYYVWSVASLLATATNSITDAITVSDTSDLTVNDEIWFPGITIGNITSIDEDGLPRAYYVANILDSTRFQISTTPGGPILQLATQAGAMTVNLPRFKVALSPNAASPIVLSTDTGTMNVNYANLRMAIYSVTISEGSILNLSLATQTVADDYIESQQGQFFTPGTLLYRPATPAPDLTVVNWQPLLNVAPVITDETIFDGGSVAWVEPVDMYDPTDRYDKYLVFPKVNILE